MATCLTSSDIKIDTILAPMEGVTDSAMRNLLAARGGLDMVCTEFCRVQRQEYPRRLVRKAVVKPVGAALSVQLMGREIDAMCQSAEILQDAGADIIDINIGCPSRKAIRGGVGSALLDDLPHLQKLLAALRAVITVPFSAKMRAGFSQAAGALDIAKMIEGEGVDFLSVHPRTSSQLYEGRADWQIIADIKSALKIAVIGNGDILCAADANAMRERSGCDGVMIGRGALRNPWIFLQLQQLNRGEKPFRPQGEDVLKSVLELHTAFIEAGFPQRNQFSRLKAHLAMLCKNIGDGQTLRREILHPQTLAELLDGCHRLLPACAPEDIHMSAGDGGLVR